MHLDLYGDWKAPKEVYEIITDSRFTRLFDIAQEGPSRYIKFHNENRNRGNHSLGVAYIISILGGDREEVIAGLIHDIGHFPFSHAIDNELSKKNHDTHEQDEIIETVLTNWIVKRYNLLELAINEKKGKYKILDNEIPRVCADRLEYTLRDGYYNELISKQELTEIIEDIDFNGLEITFSRENAKKVFELYFELNVNNYMDIKEAAIHALYGRVINLMLRKGEITIEELLTMSDTQCNQIMRKFYPELEKVNENIEVNNGRSYTLYPKFRIVNPLTHNGEHVSEFYPEFEKKKRILKEKSKPRKVDITFYTKT